MAETCVPKAITTDRRDSKGATAKAKIALGSPSRIECFKKNSYPMSQRGCCCMVRHLSDVVEIVPSEEARRQTVWRVFPSACGWSPEAF